MASKKPTTTKKKSAPAKTISKAAAVSSPVRNSAIPKVSAVKKEITTEAIAKRAYEIWASGTGGSESDNWHRAERELRGL